MIRKFLSYSLISGIILVIALGPFLVHYAHASIFGWLFGDVLIDLVWGSFVKIIAFVGNIILWLVARVLWLTAQLFSSTLKLTLLNNTYSEIPAVTVGWSLSRDLVNLFFIFILLYIAIATILQISGYGIKDLLVRVIIIALLVNFSLMITKVVIDASNILALGFYNRIQTITPAGVVNYGDITGVLMQGTHMNDIFNVDGWEGFDPNDNSEQTMRSVIINTIFGSILILVLAFVFFAATILFIIRTIVLLFLMILAPLAFLAMALPATRSLAHRWWTTLFHQAFFAPIFLFFVWIVANIIASEQFNNAINMTGVDAASRISEAFGTATGDPSPHTGIIVNYLLLIGLSIGSLVAAKQMGAYGAGSMIKLGRWAKGQALGAVGKVTLGRTASRVAQSETLRQAAAEGKMFAMPMLKGMERMAKIGDYEKDREKRIQTAMNLPPQLRAQTMATMNKRDREEMFKKMSANERAQIYEKSNLEMKGHLDEFMSEMSYEEQEKTRKARADLALKKRDEELAKFFFESPDDLKQEIITSMKEAKRTGFVDELKKSQEELDEILKAEDETSKSISKIILAIDPTLEKDQEKRRTIMMELKASDAKYLSHDARMNPSITVNLTPRHLENLMKSETLTNEEITTIKNNATEDQKKYIAQGPSRVFWGYGEEKKEEPMIKEAGKYESLDKYKAT
ncbi:MAG: hypothetical protein AB1643_01010 [Patescibacteria group bacterium]